MNIKYILIRESWLYVIHELIGNSFIISVPIKEMMLKQIFYHIIQQESIYLANLHTENVLLNIYILLVTYHIFVS